MYITTHSPKLYLSSHYESSKISIFRDYVFVILFLLFENSPFFLEIRQILWISLFVPLLAVTIINRRRIINQKIMWIMFIVWIIMFIQVLLYGGSFTPSMIYKPFWLFYTPFLLFTLMGLKYLKYLFNVIFFICIYTTAIYILHTFSPLFHSFLMNSFDYVFPYSWADWPRTILIYNIPRESGYFFERNSGIFHEPGAYAIYIILAIVINITLNKTVTNKKNAFLSLVLLTTFSTTGYIMLFLLTAYLIIKLKMSILLKPILILPLFLIFFNIYQNSNFLSAKIDAQLDNQMEAIEQGEINTRGRFYSFGMSLKSFMSAPIFGRGILTINEFDVGESGSFGYGFIGLFARYGIFFSIFYMWYFFKGFMTLCRINSIPNIFAYFAFILINLGLLTQAFFFNVPFIFFFIIGIMFRKSNSFRVPISQQLQDA